MSATENWRKAIQIEVDAGADPLLVAPCQANRNNPGLREAFVAEFFRERGNASAASRWAQEAADCGYRAD